MKYDVIFLDMDGVLADFISAAYRAHGRVYVAEEYPAGLFYIEKHWGISGDEFWSPIDRSYGFWERLRKFEWADELISLAREHAKEVKLLTSPSRHPGCFSGKRAWASEHLPNDIELILCKSKRLLASPSRLLIDDGEHNTEAFLKAGGNVILFPQPWNANAGRMHSPLSHVRAALKG